MPGIANSLSQIEREETCDCRSGAVTNRFRPSADKCVVRSRESERLRHEPAKMQTRRGGGRTGIVERKGEQCLRRSFSHCCSRASSACCFTACSGASSGSFRASGWLRSSDFTLARSLRFWPGWNSCVSATSRCSRPLPGRSRACVSAGSLPHHPSRARVDADRCVAHKMTTIRPDGSDEPLAGPLRRSPRHT